MMRRIKFSWIPLLQSIDATAQRLKKEISFKIEAETHHP